MTKMKRVSFTFPPDLDKDLTYVARRLGVSRSSLAAEMLREGLSMVVGTLRELPPEPTERDMLRYRGESKRVIDERLELAHRLRDDLFANAPDDGGKDD